MAICLPKAVIFSLLLLLCLDPKAKAASIINTNLSLGIGLRYGGWTLPFPHMKFNKKLGNGVAFVEGNASVLLFSASIGYQYPLSRHSSFYFAKTKGFTLADKYSGYKLGYVYNSNSVNDSGWVTTLELYVVDKTPTKTKNLAAEQHNGHKQLKVLPSISFGYQW